MALIVFSGGASVRVPGTPQEVEGILRLASEGELSHVSFSNETILVYPNEVAYITIDEGEKSAGGKGISGAFT